MPTESLLSRLRLPSALIEFMNGKRYWQGTSAELLAALNNLVDFLDRPPKWPRNAEGLSSELTRITPNLKAEGVEITKLPRTAKKRGWDIRKMRSVSRTGTVMTVMTVISEARTYPR